MNAEAEIRTLIVISGKGGTGKTSIAASIAVRAEHSVVADCDVDAPDLHILLRPALEENGRFVSGFVADVDESKCRSCGECLRECVFGAVRNDYSIDPLRCEGCGVCALVCPAGAVEMEPADCGEWYISKTRVGPMVHARLDPGKENSGRLASLVRTKAAELAKLSGAGTVIVDGPPGTGCPVIASMSGCDMALIVTEPTLSGMSDMKRVAELADHFKVPWAVAINKCDINVEIADAIEAFCKENGRELLGRIPYDTAVTAAQIEGKTLLEYNGCAIVREVASLCDAVIERLSNERS